MQVTPLNFASAVPSILRNDQNTASRPLTREDLTVTGITRRILAMNQEHSVNLQA